MKHLFTILISSCWMPCFSQEVSIDWQKTFGGVGYEQSFEMILTPDSNLLIVGYASPLSGDFADCGENGGYIVVKISPEGEIIWSKCYGGSEGGVANDVINTSDGGFIVVGETYSIDGDVTGAHGNADCWVVKLDANGELEWEHAYGGSNFESGTGIIQTSDEGYMVTSRSSSVDGDVSDHNGPEGSTDYWILKLNATGIVQWTKSYGGNDDDEIFGGITQDTDGNFVVAGWSSSWGGDVPPISGYSDIWVLKINPLGEIIWSKTFGGSDCDVANGCAFSNGFYYIAGGTCSDDLDVVGSHGGPGDAWLIKLDLEGNMVMQKCFGGTEGEEFLDIAIASPNELIFTGSTASNDGDLTEEHIGPIYYTDIWTVCSDTNGIINWQKSMGGALNDFSYAAVKLDDTSYFSTGLTFSNDGYVTDNDGYSDFWTIRYTVCNTLYYADADGDGFGDASSDTLACSSPPGFVADSTDCNDADAGVFPTAIDLCNTQDDNCNGLTDEDAVFVTYYADTDLDGFGDPDADSLSCTPIIDYVTNDLDCNDLDASISPVAPELCNAIDDNCNGVPDDGLVIYTHYADTDLDGFGNPDAAIDTCMESLIGYVSNGLDCNDSLPTVYPGAEEICNYLDDDCDGFIDDNLVYTWQYEDADNDLYGNVASDTLACLDVAGYVSDSTDCNDADPNIYPGAVELLNGLDDDCDGVSDEGLEITETASEQIQIFPNPNNGSFTITHPEHSEAELIINDITGRQIFSITCQGTTTLINQNDLAAGVYSCIWHTNEKMYTIVFVVQ